MEIDHENTTKITCPHCGLELMERYEECDNGEHICEECGKLFSHERHTNVRYTTKPI